MHTFPHHAHHRYEHTCTHARCIHCPNQHIVSSNPSCISTLHAVRHTCTPHIVMKTGDAAACSLPAHCTPTSTMHAASQHSAWSTPTSTLPPAPLPSHCIQEPYKHGACTHPHRTRIKRYEHTCTHAHCIHCPNHHTASSTPSSTLHAVCHTCTPHI